MSAGVRVFQDQIGKWPKVYELGPSIYEVVARHKTPTGIKRAIDMSRLVPILFALFLLPRLSKDNWGFILVGIVAGGFILFLIARSILTDLPFLTTRTTRVRFEKGRITWDKHVVGPDMPRLFRTEKHRVAAEEAQAFARSTDKTLMPVFQFATEVFIDTGEGWMHARRVAEISDDKNGEWGQLLSSTLRLVDNVAAKRANHAARQQARVDLD